MTDFGDKPWLVGESNPYSNGQKYSLYPLPDNASGARLMRILGMTQDEYLGAHHRWNLVVGRGAKWSKRQAAYAALGVAVVSGSAPVVMCGAKVTEAFGFEYAPFTVYAGRFLCFAHPSGLNRLWNTPGILTQAKRAYDDLVRSWRPA